jgi:hypothetical protein
LGVVLKTLPERCEQGKRVYRLENTICHGQKPSTIPALPENTVSNAILDIGHDHL